MAKVSSRYASALHEVALFAISLALVALVAISVAGSALLLFFAIMASAGIATAVIRWLFPEAPFFALTFANLIALYASIFAFFMEELFGRIGAPVSGLGFSLPILFFLAGCWLRREDVQAVVDHPDLRGGRRLYRALLWLLPVFLVGAGVLLLSAFDAPLINNNLAFLAAMVLIGLIVLAVSRNVAVFLVDAGLLFEEFFGRMSRLAVPAFAFLTSYSLLVIVFASIYCILSQASPEVHFRVGDVARTMSYSEAIYLSIVTISTVGYGDIVPASNAARVLISLEVVCGVLLLLFGVSELLEYTREHRREHGGRDRP
ncbi:MAG TPA: ion channel [Hyphomicrobium sp.]|jgi:voltage-gated potassium channel